jgi:hypothetical protein
MHIDISLVGMRMHPIANVDSRITLLIYLVLVSIKVEGAILHYVPIRRMFSSPWWRTDLPCWSEMRKIPLEVLVPSSSQQHGSFHTEYVEKIVMGGSVNVGGYRT